MKELILSKDGAKCLRPMIASCGSASCFEAIRALDGVKTDVPFSSVAQDENGNWRMAVFQRLQWFAAEEGINRFGRWEIVRYFAGNLHVEIMSRLSHKAGLGSYLGPEVGLVTHVLLPLKEGRYENGGHTLEFGGVVYYNPMDKGVECYHLGVIVRIPLSESEVAELLAEQRASNKFMDALAKIKMTISPPPEYFQALTCTVKEAKALQ